MPDSSASGLFCVNQWNESDLVTKSLGHLERWLNRSGLVVNSIGRDITKSPDVVASDGSSHVLIDFKSSELGPLSFDSIARAKMVADDYRRTFGGSVKVVLVGPFQIPDNLGAVASRNGVHLLSIPPKLPAKRVGRFVRAELRRQGLVTSPKPNAFLDEGTA